MEQAGLFEYEGDAKPRPVAAKASTEPDPYGDLVALFIDTSRDTHGGQSPPKRVAGAMMKAIAELKKEKINPDVLNAAVVTCAERSLKPSELPLVVWDFQAKMSPAGRDRQLITDFLEQHDNRWPTGVTFHRGTHSGNYAFDPLGYDVLPGHYNAAGSGIHRPSRDEVLEALRKR